jgi:hypothetical protein
MPFASFERIYKKSKKIDVENVLFYQSVKSEIEIPYIRAAQK